VRILAIDWGSVRVGVAISDPESKIAFAFDRYIKNKNAVSEISTIVSEKDVGKIIIGRPKSLAGSETQSTQEVENFVKQLEYKVSCPIEYVDERLSSVGASKTLDEEGVSQKKQRDLVDNLAAQQMLQSYLDTKN